MFQSALLAKAVPPPLPLASEHVLPLPVLSTPPLLNRFRLEAQIGCGATGVVYRATDLKEGKQCAVKLLLPRAQSDEQLRQRFENEARIVAQLSHPNIVSVKSFHVDSSDRLFLVMELLQGEDLDSYLRRRGRLPLAEVLQILTQAARGLHAAHQLDVVHRDIKPRNLVVCQRPPSSQGTNLEVKIVDFGIAKMAGLASVKTSQGDLLASPCYQAPELIDSAPEGVDGRADQFSLAVTGYQMLSGLSPFASVGILHTLEKVRRFIPQSLDSICSDVPHPVAAVFARAMSKNREARFPCMLSFVRALNEATAAPIASLDKTSSMPTVPISLNDSRLQIAKLFEESSGPKLRSANSQATEREVVTAPIDSDILRKLIEKANMKSGKHSVAPDPAPTAAVGLKVGAEVAAPEETATSAIPLPSAQPLQSRGDSLPGVRRPWQRWSLIVGPLFGICVGAVLAQLLIGGLVSSRYQSAGSSSGQLAPPASTSPPAALQEDRGEPSSSQPIDATRLPGNDPVHPAVYPGDSLPLRLADPLGPVPTPEHFPQTLQPRTLVTSPSSGSSAGELGPIPNYRR